MKKFNTFFLCLTTLVYCSCSKDKSTITGLQETNGLSINPIDTEISADSSYDFGAVFRGTTRTVKFRVVNSMNSAAESIVIGALDSGFNTTGGDCKEQLAVGASCTLEISFIPQNSGAANSVLKIAYTDTTTQFESERALKGSGKLRASLNYSSSTQINFGSQAIGSSNNVTLTLNNTGETEASTFSLSSLSAPFSLSSNGCGASVPAKKSCTIQVSFAPNNAAERTVNLSIGYFDGVSGQNNTFTLIGAGDNGKFNSAKGFDKSVYALLVEDAGNVYAAGNFQSFASNTSPGVIRLKSTSVLDPSFNVSEGFLGSVNTLVLSSTGKIYVGGNFSSYRGVAVNNIARLNADGTLDTSFQTGNGFNGSVNALKIDSSGRIYAGGDFTLYNTTNSRLLIRLNSDGSVDNTFAMAAGFAGSVIYALAIDANDRVYAGGSFASYQSSTSANIVCIKSDGAVETAFNAATGTNGNVRSITLTTIQTVYLAGEFTSYANSPANRLVRLGTNGTIDTGFVSGTSLDGSVYTTQLSNDGSGKLYVGGSFTNYNGNSVTSLIRINPNGSWDPTFPTTQDLVGSVYSLGQDENGSVYLGGNVTSFHGFAVNRLAKIRYTGALDKNYNVGAGFNSDTNAILSLNDNSGAILTAGQFTAYQGATRNKASKLNWDGSLENSYNTGSGFNGTVSRLISDPKDPSKTIMGGDFTSYNGAATTRIVRLNADSSLDSSLVTGTGFDNSVIAIAGSLDGANSIYVGGAFSTYQGTSYNRLVKLTNTGSIDSSFQIGAGFNGNVQSLSPATDGSGKLYVGGNFTSYNGTNVNRVVRLLSDGNIDWGFNMGTGFNDAVNIIIAVQGNSNLIYVGGKFTNYKGSRANSLIRLNSNGSADTSFDPGAGFDEAVTALQESSDGARYLYVGGAFAFCQGIKTNSIARLTFTGGRDSSFNVGKGFNNSVNTIAVAKDGSKDIYIGGAFTSYNGVTTDTAVRLDQTGKLE